MEEDTLKDPFQVVAPDDEIDEGIQHSREIPSVNVVPPNTSREGSSKQQQEKLKSGSPIKEFWNRRNRSKSNDFEVDGSPTKSLEKMSDGKKFKPQLKLRIPSFNITKQPNPSATSLISSNIFPNFGDADDSSRIRKRSRARSSSANLESESVDDASSRASGRASRSNKVLSYIAADDMDEFEDLQKEFRSAVDDKGFGWLPPLANDNISKSDVYSSITAKEEDGTAIDGTTTVEPSAKVEDETKKAEETNDDKNKVNMEREQYEPGFFNQEIQVEDVELDTVNETVQLPNFDEFFNDDNLINVLNLYGNSLGLFGPENKVRMFLAKMHINRKYTLMYYVALILFTILLSVRTYYSDDYNFIYNIHNHVDIVCFILCVIFSFHDLTKMISFGFWDDSQLFEAFDEKYVTIAENSGLQNQYNKLKKKYGKIIDTVFPFCKVIFVDESQTPYKRNPKEYDTLPRGQSRTNFNSINEGDKKNKNFDCPRAFSRSSWNRVDLVASCSFYIGLFSSLNHVDDRKGARIFKALSLLRILKLLDTDTGISSIIRAFKQGSNHLISIGSMLVYFWVFIGILGAQIFRGSLRRQCVWTNPNDPNDTYQYDMQFCGGHLNPETGKRSNYIFADGTEGPISKGFLCPVNSKCISNANPYNGRVSFDNIVNSMELVFVIMSSNTFTDIMYYMMDAEEIAACLFFIFAIFLLTIWLLNLLIAALVSSFEVANQKFEHIKSRSSDFDSKPLKLIKGYWRYFLFKANRNRLNKLSETLLKYYNNIEFLFVILLVVDFMLRAILSSESSSKELNRLYKLDAIFSGVLFAESLIRIVLHYSNIWKFITKPTYMIDLFLSLTSFIISVIQVAKPMGQTYFWLSFFQIARSYRIVYNFEFTKTLWHKVLGNRLMIWNLTAFYFLFIYLASLIFAVYFEGVVPQDQSSETPFALYNLSNTFLSLFIIGSTENWTTTLYAVQEYSQTIISAFISSAMVIVWLILSNFMILNIFIAIIAQSFKVKEEEKRYLQIRHYLKYVYPKRLREYTHATLLSRIKKKVFGSFKKEKSKDFKQFLIRGTAIMNIAHNMEDLMESLNNHQDEKWTFRWIWLNFRNLPVVNKFQQFTNNPFYKDATLIYTMTNEDAGQERSYILKLNEHEEEKIEYLKLHPSFNYSYFLFPPDHRLRIFCQRLIPSCRGKRTDGVNFYDDSTDVYTKKNYFNHIERDLFVLVMGLFTFCLIFLSCYVTPIYRMQMNDSHWNWENYCNYIILGVFTCEFLIKTIADGFIYAPNAYLTNPWNIIDFFVLISIWIDFIATLGNDNELARSFKGLTALRALRCLTVSNTARQTFVIVIYDGIGKIFEAGLVSLTLLVPFTVWGMNLFRGRLATCNDGSLGRDGCNNEYSNEIFKWDILSPRVYSNPILYMDSFSSAFRSLYEIISLEGWSDLLSNLINSTGVGSAASTAATPINALFLITFNFLSMVFILNLFVSFIVNNHAKTIGTAYQTTEEKSWVETKKILSQASPLCLPDFFSMSMSRRVLYDVAVKGNNFYYSLILRFFLYLHVIFLLCISYRGQSTSAAFTTKYFMFSSVVFLFHESFRIHALGVKLYFNNFWNLSKFTIFAFSFLFTAIGFHLSASNYWFINVEQVFHLLVFLLLIPQNDKLTELLQTAMASWPPILSLSYTWGILFLVYAIALNQIFGLTRLGPNTTDNINFRTVIKAMIVLFRCSFGEGWNYIMSDLTVEEPFCYKSAATSYSDCGSQSYAYLLLISWNIISMYIFMKMFISLIIGSFSYVHRTNTTELTINKSEIRKFSEAWAKYDSDGTGTLGFQFLPKIMHSFEGPLSFTLWEGRLTISSLVENYMKVNPDDPYDVKVDLEGLNEQLSVINKKKMAKRKWLYRRFVQQVQFYNAYNQGMDFSELLQQIPLFTTYNARECLGIDDYVNHLYVMGKVDKFLNNQRNVDALNMITVKWRYLQKIRAHKKFKTNPSQSSKTLTARSTDTTKIEEQVSILKEATVGTPAMDYGINHFIWSPGQPNQTNEDSFPARRLTGEETTETTF